MRRRGATAARILTWSALAAAATCPLAAQTIDGRVIDGTNENGVGGASVALVDRDGAERARALTDSVGRFLLRPPEAGEYYLTADRLGYAAARSPLLALTTEGRAALELVVEPEPIGLEGFEVSVEAEAHEYLKQFGLTEPDLGKRWIDRRDIEAVAIRPEIGSIIEWQNIPGVTVRLPEDYFPREETFCVSLQRARMGSGSDTCAMVVLNGVPVPSEVVLSLDPEMVEAMAVLLPTETTLYYGTQGATGAVLVWTRR